MEITGFEWDLNKAERNFKDHNITFEEGMECFWNSNYLKKTYGEKGEQRYILLGKSDYGNYLTVIFEYKKDGFARIISARKMSKWETSLFRKKVRR